MAIFGLSSDPGLCPVRSLGRQDLPYETGANADSQVLDRERLYMEFAPLVTRLVRLYGQDAEMRQDLKGEIYYHFCALLDVYDPTRGVPLRPYLVRQLSARIYTYARQQWRIRQREIVWQTEEGKPARRGSTRPTPSTCPPKRATAPGSCR